MLVIACALTEGSAGSWRLDSCCLGRTSVMVLLPAADAAASYASTAGGINDLAGWERLLLAKFPGWFGGRGCCVWLFPCSWCIS